MAAKTAVQARHQKGAPASTGGQWKTESRPESGTGLDSPASASAQYQALSDREILSKANRVAQFYANRNARVSLQDVEDLAQTAIVDLLQSRTDRGTVISGELLHHRVRQLASGLADSHTRHEDSRGLALFKKQSGLLEQKLGRPLTTSEADTLAAEIRDSWPDKRHRPSRHFHRENRPSLSIDSDPNEGRQKTTEEALSLVYEPIPYSDELAEKADAVAARDMSGMERRWRRYEMFADAFHLPPAVRGTVPVGQVTRAKKAVKGRLVEVCRAYLAGEHVDDSMTRAVFAPFGDISMKDRDRVAAALARFPDRAEDLWTAAINMANTRNPGATYGDA